MSENPTILDVRNLSRSFGGLQAVRDASFEVERGSITSLIGPNGAGKTTAFNLITGFYPADEGEVIFEGQPIQRLGPHLIARRGLTRTFQTPRIIRRLTVLENMVLAAPDQPGDNPFKVVFTPGRVRRADKAARERAEELLDFIALHRLKDAFAGQLSGGQRKLLEFGRALMAEPTLVMLDEPMAGVNRTLGKELLGHIRTMRDEHGVTFVIIEHDMEMVMSVSDQVVVLNQGQVLEIGTADEVQSSQAVIDAYLGGDTASVDADQESV